MMEETRKDENGSGAHFVSNVCVRGLKQFRPAFFDSERIKHPV